MPGCRWARPSPAAAWPSWRTPLAETKAGGKVSRRADGRTRSTARPRSTKSIRHAPEAPLVDVAGDVAARVRRERAEQGMPEKVEDPVTLAKVATLAFEGLPTPSRTP